MRLVRVLLLASFGALLFSLHAFAGVADSVAYQGRLTDASALPVPDGTRDLILSIWTDSVGGTMLHSETVVVTTTGGLFSTCLGCGSSSFPEVFDGQTLYLQTQLAGQAPLVPRIRIGSAAYAISSSSLHGEATSGSARGRGIISVKSPTGSGSMQGLIYLDADSDDDGHHDFVISDSVTTSSAHRLMGGDHDDDGLSDAEISSMLTPTTSSMAIKTKGTGAAHGRSSITSSTQYDSASLSMEYDDDDDNVPEQDFQTLLTPTTSSMAIKTKGTGAAHNRTVTIGSSTDTSGATQTADCDDDGDGIAESSVQSHITPTTSSLAIKTKGTSAKRLSFTAACDDSSSSTLQACDDDGDGHDDTFVSSGADSSGASLRMKVDGLMGPRMSTNLSVGRQTQSSTISQGADSDGDGVDDASFSSIVTPTTSSVAIKSKGLPYGDRVPNLSAGGDCDDTDASLSARADLDDDGLDDLLVSNSAGASGASSTLKVSVGGSYKLFSVTGQPTPVGAAQTRLEYGSTADGLAKRWVVDATGPDIARRIVAADLDADGVADRTITEQCDDGDASISIDEPGVHLSMSSGGASGAAEIAIDEPGVHVAVARKGWDGTIKGNFHIDSGGARTINFDGDGVGYVAKRFGIGDTNPTNPLSLASGAHCTPGGVWTNASDMNLKENFQEVDGADILDKIESLPITEWNYKNEDDGVKHIGPTAQDFQATFGVGSDGKSISTIDPSGIALAAIKQLKKENTELKKQVEELSSLKAEVEELKKLLTEKK